MDPGSWWGCHVERCQEMEAWPGILSGIDGAKGFDINLLKSYTIIFRLGNIDRQIDRQRLLSQFGLLLPQNIMPEEARVYQVRRVRGRFPCLDKDTPSSYPRPLLFAYSFSQEVHQNFGYFTTVYSSSLLLSQLIQLVCTLLSAFIFSNY